MKDLIIQGDPRVKTLTLAYPVTVNTPEGIRITLPAGLEITGIMEYFYPALDNDPTFLKKATMLTDQTQAALGMPPDSDTYVGTPNDALMTLFRRAVPSTFQQLSTGRLGL